MNHPRSFWKETTPGTSSIYPLEPISEQPSVRDLALASVLTFVFGLLVGAALF